MTHPQLSIGISFKNPGSYFKLALQSIFAQTFTDWELILMDDGSTDESLTLAKQLNDRRVRVYCDGESRGLNVRLNQLVKLANAPYFLRMDADDIMHPQRLEKQYQQLIQHDENTVVGSAAYSIDAKSQVVGLRPVYTHQRSGFDARHSFIHPTIAASTEWFRHNPYSEHFVFQRSQDAELWCRTTNTTKFVNLTEPLLYYRESGTFSFTNYLGTSLGLLYLICIHHTHPRYRFFYLFFRELIKLSIMSIVDCLNLADYLISRRYQPLSLDISNSAISTLDLVQGQPLPLE
jgi:glycosyltransferase involved in cell wall biosynthesis